MKKEYIANFDLIRIIAATIIVFHHYQQITSIKFGGMEFYGGLFPFGYLVELFFIISGFLTEYTFRDESKFSVWIYLKLKRYYPLSIIATISCLGIAIVYYLFAGTPLFGIKYDIFTIITSITLTHTGWLIEYSAAVNNPTWYLCILTLCYLLYWVLKRLLRKKKGVINYFLVISIISAFLYYLIQHGFILNLPFLRLGNARGYGAFFIGSFLCQVWKKYRRGLLVIVDVVLWSLSSIGFYGLGFSNWYVYNYCFFPALVLTALLLPQIKNKIIKIMGVVSFEVYIWHVFLMSVSLTILRITGYEMNHSYGTMLGFAVISWLWGAGVHFLIKKRKGHTDKEK